MAGGLETIPLDIRSFPMGTAVVSGILLPVHTRSRTTMAGAEGRGLFSGPFPFIQNAGGCRAGDSFPPETRSLCGGLPLSLYWNCDEKSYK